MEDSSEEEIPQSLQKTSLPVAPFDESFNPDAVPTNGEEYLRLVRYEMQLLPNVFRMDESLGDYTTAKENLPCSYEENDLSDKKDELEYQINCGHPMEETLFNFYKETKEICMEYLKHLKEINEFDSKIFSFPHENDAKGWFNLIFKGASFHGLLEGPACLGGSGVCEEIESLGDAADIWEEEEIEGGDMVDESFDETDHGCLQEIEENNEKVNEIPVFSNESLEILLDKDSLINPHSASDTIGKVDPTSDEEGELVANIPDVANIHFLVQLSQRQITCLLEHFVGWISQIEATSILDLPAYKQLAHQLCTYGEWIFGLLLFLDQRLISTEISVLRELCKAAVRSRTILENMIHLIGCQDDLDFDTQLQKTCSFLNAVVAVTRTVYGQRDLSYS